MILRPLELADCEEVRRWRNESLETLRTPYPLTREMQEQFYRDVVQNPDSQHRYYAVIDERVFIGMVGLTYISQPNASAEISLIIDPDMRGQGLGLKAAELILSEGLGKLNLEVVYGEVYFSNPDGVSFWREFARSHGATTTMLPDRKRWNGRFYDSFYFSIRKTKDM